jgi:methionyl-tRNA formyltransferase
MKIVYLGSGEFGIECLNALAGSKHNPALIVTQPSQQAGRGRRPRPTPVAGWAKEHSVEFIETEDVNKPEMVGRITAPVPDLILVIAFGQKIGNELINLPPKGAINVHASLLPKYRGAAPINWAIINGERETGISIITLAEKMDAGEILAQEKTEILENETAGELHDRLAKIAAQLLTATLEQIAGGTATYTEQDHSAATLAPKLKKSDGFLDFADSAQALRRKILGFWPWPGASAIYTSKEADKSARVTIAMASAVEVPHQGALAAGTLDEDLNVICGENALKIARIKPDGSRLMDFADFVNGQHTRPGDILTRIEK